MEPETFDGYVKHIAISRRLSIGEAAELVGEWIANRQSEISAAREMLCELNERQEKLKCANSVVMQQVREGGAMIQFACTLEEKFKVGEPWKGKRAVEITVSTTDDCRFSSSQVHLGKNARTATVTLSTDRVVNDKAAVVNELMAALDDELIRNAVVAFVDQLQGKELGE